MSAPGVLAVMADAIRYERKADAADGWIAELVAAHDAVAGLIQNAQETAAWLRAFAPERSAHIERRLTSALARCKGAQA
jgi:hypothetical protein